MDIEDLKKKYNSEIVTIMSSIDKFKINIDELNNIVDSIIFE